MMKIKSLQTQYVQKSRLFLYPALGIKRGVSVTPIQTFMQWNDHYLLEDNKLICVYHMRDDKEFRGFEEEKLLGNRYFQDWCQLENESGAYTFDLSDLKEEYNKIVTGKYSQLSEEYKLKVLDFFKNHHRHHDYILSYLYPTQYIDDYARLLGVDRKLLLKVGELCSLPDLEQEKLLVSKKIINFESSMNLQTNNL